MARTEGEEGGERAAGGRLVRDGGEEARLEVGDGPDGWGPHGGERRGKWAAVGPKWRRWGEGGGLWVRNLAQWEFSFFLNLGFGI